MVTGDSGARVGSEISVEVSDGYDENYVQKAPRPIGVSLLAVWNYLCSACFTVLALVILISPSVVRFLIGSADDDLSVYDIEVRAGISGVLIVLAAASYFFGRAFWMTKNWVREWTIALSVLGLIIGGPPSELWGRAVSVVLIWYLLTPEVKASFGVSRPARLNPANGG